MHVIANESPFFHEFFRFLEIFVTFGNRELPMFIGIIEVGVPSSTALSNGELAHGVLLKYHGSMLGDGVV